MKCGFLSVRVVIFGLFAINLIFCTSVFAEKVISKRTMSQCFFQYKKNENLFKDCCMLSVTDKKIEKTTKTLNNNENNSGKNRIDNLENVTKGSERNTQENDVKVKCEKQCNGHNFCYFDIKNNTCHWEGVAETKNSGKIEDFEKRFISNAEPVWDKKTKTFKCIVPEYGQESLKQYNWHWNYDIAECTYTFNGREYLGVMKINAFYEDLHKKRGWPWLLSASYYDNSTDEQVCKSIDSSCEFSFEYPGIPKCFCGKGGKTFKWVYGQRVCEYCEQKNNKQDCRYVFDSELTHWLGACLGGLAVIKDTVVNFK